MTNWRDSLPSSKFETWIIRIFIIIVTFYCGYFAGQVKMSSSFERGMDYMQKSYTTKGMVERVVITGNSTRIKE